MIVFSSVSKSFADKQTAIVDLNLEINEGDLLVITGPSGAGKTTLMKLLIREYLPTSGEITFENTPLSQLKNSEIPALRRKIGVVFQDYKLIEEMNVWENIALPLYISNKKDEEIESRVTDLLNLIGLADKALQFPRQLSGGEAQRVSIARALSVGPKIIFADEPTGNLDSEATIKITRLLKKINELGTTLLFATHDQLVLDELGKGKIIHLDKKEQSEPKKQNESTPEPIGEEKIDEEREKVKEKLDKLAKEETKKEETKPKLSLADRLSFPKLKLKIGSKKIKNNDQKEKNKDKKEEKKKNEST
ncbi:ATP-binding cassette domain-containing protein [Patescibacteria group bacterium]|nr:ATP-binding cassette domain-containing protein [Patescibacteria group bacterium]